MGKGYNLDRLIWKVGKVATFFSLLAAAHLANFRLGIDIMIL